MLCKNCGKYMPKGYYFCDKCGAFLYESDNSTKAENEVYCFCEVAKFLNEYKSIIALFAVLILIIRLIKKAL